ncbi:lipopolysaccharide heptosyltransferase I, partial [Neisseria sp. P0021.S007]
MKILLVRLSSMGDLIHTLPAIEDLARQCPDVEL